MAYVYGLVDQRFPDHIRYVGRTKLSVEKRLYNHINASHLVTSSTYLLPSATWIRYVCRSNSNVVAVVLSVVVDRDMLAAEHELIERIKPDLNVYQ